MFDDVSKIYITIFGLLWWWKVVMKICNEFFRWFHQFFSQFFFYEIFSVGAKHFFSQIASWKRSHDKYSIKELIDSEFKIGETIWWICYRLEVELTNLLKCGQKFTKTNIRDCCSDDGHILCTDFFYQSRSLSICIKTTSNNVTFF